MNRKEKSREHFDAIAENYESSFDGKFVNSMYEKIYKSAIEYCEGGSVLDLGCGTGNLLAMLSNHKQYQLTGIDFSEGMITEASKRFQNTDIELQVGDVADLPFKDNRFDMIICNASFHHYTNPQKAMSEIKRVLRQGGYFIMGDPTSSKFIKPFANLYIKFTNSGDYHLYSQQEMKKLIENYGFTINENKLIGKRKFMIVAKLTTK